MTCPTRCLSSYLTTELLKYRNPLGGEENWFGHDEARQGHLREFNRVVVAEIGVALLCVTATIESLAYVILVIGSVPLLCLSAERPFNWSIRLLSSSSFTIYWNLGNLTSFNLFSEYTCTHESFARLAIDRLEEGTTLSYVITALHIGCIVLSIFNSNFQYNVSSYELHRFLNRPCLRPEDRIYLGEWFTRHPIDVSRGNIINILDPQIHQVEESAQEITQSIEEGTEFFRRFILHSNEITLEVKKQIVDADAEIFIFVLTRTIYLYVFGSKKDEEIPSFLKQETQRLIAELRTKYRGNDKGKDLELRMKNPDLFEQEIEDQESRAIFNDLKKAAHKELQNSLYSTRCWEQACAGSQQT